VTRPLQPLAAFARAGSPRAWRTLTRFTLFRTAQLRLRVSVQQHENPAEGLARDAALAEQGVEAAEHDAREFAAEFVRQAGAYLSARDVELLVVALQDDLVRRRTPRPATSAPAAS
jgi:hypothetical protein